MLLMWCPLHFRDLLAQSGIVSVGVKNSTKLFGALMPLYKHVIATRYQLPYVWIQGTNIHYSVGAVPLRRTHGILDQQRYVDHPFK